MKLGIIGLAGSGKTTVFNAVSGAHAEVGGYGQPGEVHRAMVKIPDPRLEALGEMLQSQKIVHAEIEFIDFPPPDRREPGAENVFPHTLRECEGIAAVLNCFDSTIERTLQDRLQDLQGDMMLADFIVVEKRRTRMEKDASRGVKVDTVELGAIRKAVELLESERPLRGAEFSSAELFALRGFALLTAKPLLVILNTAEGKTVDPAIVEQIETLPIMGHKTAVASLCGKIEMELADLDQADQASFLADFNITESATSKMIRLSYDLLDLITFFTGAEKESRAWPIRRGTTAVDAAGEIHQDMKRGFIRAEVAPVDTFIELGGMAACRKAAVARLEGKEYTVNDGDYILFRFNV
jgi:GTP-binding protein YchF